MDGLCRDPGRAGSSGCPDPCSGEGFGRGCAVRLAGWIPRHGRMLGLLPVTRPARLGPPDRAATFSASRRRHPELSGFSPSKSFLPHSRVQGVCTAGMPAAVSGPRSLQGACRGDRAVSSPTHRRPDPWGARPASGPSPGRHLRGRVSRRGRTGLGVLGPGGCCGRCLPAAGDLTCCSPSARCSFAVRAADGPRLFRKAPWPRRPAAVPRAVGRVVCV